MSVRVSGSGTVEPGSYEQIHISGSGKITGPISCSEFHCSGSVRCAGDVEVGGEMHLSGSADVKGAVAADILHVSGSASMERCTAATELKCSGSLKCAGQIQGGVMRVSGSLNGQGSIQATELSVSGILKCGGDLSAEDINVRGVVDCEGLMNAEKIDIEFARGMHIDSIGGGTVRIVPSREGSLLRLLPKLVGARGTVEVKNAIEADTVTLEAVYAQAVRGRTVVIGADCRIGLVQYSGTAEIDPSAHVERCEKTE